MNGFRCGGIIGPDTTREELRDRGITEEGIDELEDYQTYLVAKERGVLDCDYETWRERGRICASCEHPLIPIGEGTSCQGCADEQYDV